MQILVLQGSPNKNGSTAILIDAFRNGAQRAGHAVEVIDTTRVSVHPCGGCIHCGYEGPCIIKDDMEQLKERILSADMLVFATPLYYYGMTAQLKTVVDRFCAFNTSLNCLHLKSALLTVAWNEDPWTFDALESHYKTLVRYCNFEDIGEVLGYGCGTPAMTMRSHYPKAAEELGERLSQIKR